MRRVRLFRTSVFCLLPFALTLGAVFLSPAPVQAQWYFAGYLGANHTRPATVFVSQPSRDTSIQYHRVVFRAEPFKSPQYYGWRLGKRFGARRLGVEFELIHLKVISETHDRYVSTGRIAGRDVGSASYMDGLVQRYAMTHGLNFLLVNVVARVPVGTPSGPLCWILRAGAGPTLPHAETSVDFQSLEQYEYGGLGVHGAAGLNVHLHARLSATVEYKLTYAKPTITIVDGTGQTTALTHQAAAGLVFDLSR